MRNLTFGRVVIVLLLLAVTLAGSLWTASAQGEVPSQEPRQSSIDRVEPRTLQAGVGGMISVYGNNFTPDSVVRLKGVGLLATTYINSLALTAEVPPTIPSGLYGVEVRDPVMGTAEWHRTLEILPEPPPPLEVPPTQEPIPTQEPLSPPTAIPGEPRLTARGYTVTPDTVRPGEGLAVTFELVNLGNRTAQSIIAALDPSGKFLPSGGLASMTVPDVAPGNTFLVSLSAVAAQDLTSGPAVIPISLTYRDFEGNTYDTTVSFSVTVEAVAQATQLTVSEYTTTPDPVEPGRRVQMQIVVTNAGTLRATQALLRVGGTDSLLLAGPQGDSFPLGNLEPGESRTVTADMVVRADAKAGPQPQPYTITYLQRSESAESTGTITLDVTAVEATEPLLLLQSYEIDSSDLKPGDRFTLTAVLANVGTGAATNLLATFGTVTGDGGNGGSGSGTGTTPGSTFAPLGTGGTIFVGTLDADGGTATLTQEFIVSGSASSGVYTLPVTLRYPDSEGETVTASLSASLIVVVPPDLQFNDFPLPPEVNVGEPLSISVAFTNIGENDVLFRSATVEAENGEILDGESVFIGTVPEGEDGAMSAMVMPLAEGPVRVTVDLNYIDELNQPRTISRTFETVAVMPPPPPDEEPVFPPFETPEPTPPPPPTFAESLGKLLLGLLGLGS